MSSISSTRRLTSALSFFLLRGPYATLSHTVMCGNSA